MTPDYGSLNPRDLGARYIHSSVNNFLKVYETFDFKKELESTYLELLDVLQMRINHMKSLRIAYSKLISPSDPDNALSILNDIYNKSLLNPDSLLGASLLIKDFSTYYRTTKKSDPNYLENYGKQVVILLEAFSNYKRLMVDLRDRYKGDKMFDLADERLTFAANGLDRYVNKYMKDNGIELLDRKDSQLYNRIFTKIRRNLKTKKLGQISKDEESLLRAISYDGAIGILRESAISEEMDKHFKLDKTGLDVLNIGTYNTSIQRADTFETKVKVDNIEYYLGFNVKSFSKPYKGDFVARSFSGTLKNSKNKGLYNSWAYLIKNINALEEWDSNLFGEYLKEKDSTYPWENRNEKVPANIKKELLNYESLFSQIYHVAGFLDGFLELTEDNKFVPQFTEIQSKQENRVNMFKEYIYSVALAMQDQVFWVDELLQSIHDIYKRSMETVLSGTGEGSKVLAPGFSSSASVESINPFLGSEDDLIKLYKTKLKKIKKAAGNYSTMMGFLNDLNKFENINIDNVKKVKYYMDPYTLKGTKIRRININTRQFE